MANISLDKTDQGTAPPSVSAIPRSPKLAHTKELLGVLVTALPLIGALGTAFVWGMTYFYVGNVEVAIDRPYRSLDVGVYSLKGSQCEFHAPRFQLMPGTYCFHISVDGKPAINYVASVHYRKNTSILLGHSMQNEVSSDEPNPVSSKTPNAVSSKTPNAVLSETPNAVLSKTPNAVLDKTPIEESNKELSKVSEADDQRDNSEPKPISKKRWWQLWRK